MATDDVRKGFLGAMLQWKSSVSIVTKATTPQGTILTNQQVHNDNVVIIKTSNQKDVAMTTPMRYAYSNIRHQLICML